MECVTERCKCIAETLARAGWRFKPLMWLPVSFTAEVRGGVLRLEAWHDVGASVVEIPLASLTPQLADALSACAEL